MRRSAADRPRLLQERERLFSEAAHEFRTPLAIIGCNAELISEGLIGGADARQAARVIMETVHETDLKLSQLLESARRRLEPGGAGVAGSADPPPPDGLCGTDSDG
ncbi:MAG: hypothetical protein NVS2B16_37990 [Chloroflexota bacterium]